ncbi:MAG: hypothetical protein KTR33_08180 [Gammaproteobacteria bacterium]|nr:hypothetical protein [Gammaproteobacteria bacterium]
MKLAHRRMHRTIWLMLFPVLFLAVLLLSNTKLETMPVNASVPGLNQSLAASADGSVTGSTDSSELLEYRVLP